jgi:outer membrane biosynthesis protein TonB
MATQLRTVSLIRQFAESSEVNFIHWSVDRKAPKDRERSEKKVIKLTSERELKKETPAREQSRDQGREPTPREKSVKEVKVKDEKRDRETKEREEVDHTRKREKEKERRREKRQTSPPVESFEADLSSVSNSSNGSIHPSADIVIVDDQRGM